MPELPEIETVCRGLNQSVRGREIMEIELRRPDIRIPIPDDFSERIQNAQIDRIERRAKYLLLHLDNDYTVIVHLGMSGQLMVLPEWPEVPKKHDHALFLLDNGQVMLFNDPRRFGVITGCRIDELAEHPLLKELGPEPFSDTFNAEYLHYQCQKRAQAIKPLLMDQKIVVGVGNIYASEALFSSRILPNRSAKSITLKEAEILVQQIRETLLSAIESGGSTLRNYVNSMGQNGYFQHRFLVYDKEGKPCAVCSTPIQKIVQTGRATYFCVSCQK